MLKYLIFYDNTLHAYYFIAVVKKIIEPVLDFFFLPVNEHLKNPLKLNVTPYPEEMASFSEVASFVEY